MPPPGSRGLGQVHLTLTQEPFLTKGLTSCFHISTSSCYGLLELVLYDLT